MLRLLFNFYFFLPRLPPICRLANTVSFFCFFFLSSSSLHSCSGLHDVVRLRKEGYSYRLDHSDFVRRFYPLLRWQARHAGKSNSKEGLQHQKKGTLSKVASMRTMRATRTSSEQSHDIIDALSHVYPNLCQECVVGNTKVLIREQPYQWLERYLVRNFIVYFCLIVFLHFD